MKTSTKIILVIVLCLQVNLFAQEGNITLSFSGQDNNSGNTINLESVYIKNVTQNCDTTIFGSVPSIDLSWPLRIDNPYSASGFTMENCYPNPFLGSSTFKISMVNNEAITIRLLNTHGIVVSEYNRFLHNGAHTFKVSINQRGLYYLTVSNGTVTHTQKLLNQNSKNGTSFQIDYFGEDQYKTTNEITAFVFQPGDQLMMQAGTSNYMGFTINDTPENDSTYIFNLSLIERKVLLELYTGQKCVNCAEAEIDLHELQAQYESQLSLISIHAGYYAEPDISGYYTADFISETGADLHSDFGVVFNPVAMVNRMDYGSGVVLPVSELETIIESEISETAEAFILINNIYNNQTKELNTKLELKFLENFSGNFKICAFITEDNIVSPQKNNNQEIGPTPDWLDYNHRNMLRGSLNGTWGDLVADGDILAGSVYTLLLDNFTLNEEWKDEDCMVVAFLYNEETFEILQVAQEIID